jgi:uracil-DNA glycosylase family 4
MPLKSNLPLLSPQEMVTWTGHVTKWSKCRECPLCERRTKVVLARGTIPADILFVGEAPGPSEDLLGVPFCGPAGRLLDQIIKESVPREVDYCLSNLICCIPLEDESNKFEEPPDESVEACKPRLLELIDLVQPKLLVCVGRCSRDWFDQGYRHSIKLRKEVRKIDIIHPAAVLRVPLAHRGLMIQRAVVNVTNAVEEMLDACANTKTG